MKNKTQSIAFIALGIGIVLAVVSSSEGISNTWQELLETTAFSLIPSSIIALLYEYSIRKNFVIELNDQISSVIDKQFESVRNTREFGIKKCISKLSESDLNSIIEESDTQIRIVKNWMPKLFSIEESLLEAVKRGAKVEICLTSPDSEFSTYRSECLGKNNDAVRDYTKATLKELKEYIKKHAIEKSVEVRLSNRYVPISIHQADNTVIFGIMWEGMLANHNPMIVVSGYDKILFKKIKTHSNNIWDKAVPIDWSTI